MSGDDDWSALPTARSAAPGDDPDRALALRVVYDDRSLVVPLAGASTLTLGRARDADLLLEHASISRLHARLVVGAEITIEDLGSANGTRLRGVALAPNTPARVQLGEVIELGDVVLLLQRGGAPAEPAVRRAPPPAVPPDAVVADPSMQRLYRLAASVADSHLNILLLGETGVGKEVLAGAVHQASPRRDRPLVALNCAALPEALLESELFGYEPGAFTGATRRKLGLFESADGGTVFLDEIGDMPLVTQSKVLRVLEQGEVQPLGALRPKKVDVRFVAATHRDLRARAAEGSFREDLLYRLDGITLVVPPLRQRQGDIEPLAEAFAAAAARRQGRAPPQLSAALRQRLREHSWPGNVRELRNVIERAVVLAAAGEIAGEHLMLGGGAAAPSPEPPAAAAASLPAGGDERARIEAALAASAGNQSAAAEILGMSRSTLLRRLRQFELPRPQRAPRR